MTLSIVQRLPGRLQIEVPGLRSNTSLAARLRAGLKSRPEITAYAVNARTGRLLVFVRSAACLYQRALVELAGEGYRPAGALSWVGSEPTEQDEAALLLTLAAGVLASDARLVVPEPAPVPAAAGKNCAGVPGVPDAAS